MAYTIDTVDVYAGSIENRPGGLAEKLTALSEAGANLEFVIARRTEKGQGVMFCAPLKCAKQSRAAKKVGLTKSESLRSLRITGPDKAGLGEKITVALANAGVNVRVLDQGSSEMNIIVGVEDVDLGKAVRAIYEAFESWSKETPQR